MQGFPPHVIAWLASRGISVADALAAELVWDGRRLGIPIIKADGTRFYKWRRDPATDKMSNAPPKYMADTGGSRSLFGREKIARHHIVAVCEGELDAIRLSLAWPDVATVSSTTGASNWDEEWDRLFADKFVVFMYDADEAGNAGARLAAQSVARWADSVWVVDHDAKAGKDVTDLCQRGRFTLADALASRGPFFARQIPARTHDWKDKDASPRRDGPKPPILAVIEGRYGVKLRRRGREWHGLCPIHGDKNPSLDVNEEKGLWVCRAGCGGGDAYEFVAKMEDCDFRAAKKIIDEMNLTPV